MIAFSRDDNSYLSRWWWTVDRVVLALLVIMIMLGFFLTLTASTVAAERQGDPLHFVKRQGVFLTLAVAVLLGMSLLTERWVRRLAALGFIGAFVGIVLTLIVGKDFNGAQRWLSIAGQSVQPSEFIKPCFAVVTAWVLSIGFADRTLPVKQVMMIPLAAICLLLSMQPDYGQMVLVLSVCMAQLALAGLSLRWIMAAGSGGVMLLVVGFFTSDHVSRRILSYIDPASQDNYQVDKALEAMGSGGLLGRGLGEGQVKLKLPDAHSDYIFAVIGEEFGAIACLMLILVYAGIVLRILASLLTEENAFRFLAVAGLVAQFGLQAIINIGVSLAVLPSKGMTLPFISYGGSSLLALALGMGMVLALTRRNRYARVSSAAPGLAFLK